MYVCTHQSVNPVSENSDYLYETQIHGVQQMFKYVGTTRKEQTRHALSRTDRLHIP
jgi:hypothetical protein